MFDSTSRKRFGSQLSDMHSVIHEEVKINDYYTSSEEVKTDRLNPKITDSIDAKINNLKARIGKNGNNSPYFGYQEPNKKNPALP